MYISPTELTTHLGAEQIEAISDGDETLLTAAIDAGTQEAKSYLKAYDIDAELAKTGSARNALLMIFIKDIAVWHFINICHVNTSLELRQDRYKTALAWLKAVQKGEVLPDLPAIVDADGEANNLPYKVTSNPKRTNHI
jgi:phage gp36-like protein